MSHDDDAYTVDTRRGAGRRPRGGARRPAEEPQQIPVRRPESDGRVGRLPQRPAGSDRQPTSGARPPQPRDDSTRVMPAGTRGGSAGASGRGAPPRGRPDRAQRPGGGSGGPRGGTGGGRPGGGGGAPVRRRRKHPWRRALVVVVVILAVWVAGLVYAGYSAWGKVTKVDAIPTDSRPAAGKGTNVVLVGSDSRAGLTAAQGRALGTGGSKVSAGAAHTDSIMILHMPDSGSPTLVSVPRDSWVPIPGHGSGKINASFTYGGGKLLVQTLENTTGLRIDDYMEIGFGGFAGVVDSVGGVRMCLPEHVKDSYAHINLPKGCQVLNGKNALGYVRSRHAFATGDLARVQHQREFLAALMKKVASPSRLLVPWRLKSIGESGAQGIAVNKGMSPITALKIMWTLKGITNGGNSVQVPIGNANYMVDGQDAVLWDHDKALAMFHALNNDQSVNVKP